MSQFNPPRFKGPIAPIPSQSQRQIILSEDEYNALRGYGRAEVAQPHYPNVRPVDDGYRRYAKCLQCQQAYKIFTCYANSDQHCKQFGPPTHTHFTCNCGVINMEGSVRIGTKKDRVVYVYREAPEEEAKTE